MLKLQRTSDGSTLDDSGSGMHAMLNFQSPTIGAGVLLVVCAITACVDQPRNKQQLTSMSDGVKFHGATAARSDAIRFTYNLTDRYTGAKTQQTLWDTSTGYTGTADSTGELWYQFSRDAVFLPDDYRAWEAGPPGKVQLRLSARNVTRNEGLYTFDTDADARIAQHCNNTSCSVRSTVLNASNGTNNITLYAPCGTDGELCCLPNDTCNSGLVCSREGTCEESDWLTASDVSRNMSFPSDAEWDWTDNLQGIAKDNSHSYITQRYRMWKVPLGTNLNQDLNGRAGVTRVGDNEDEQMPSWAPATYDHLGDLDLDRARNKLVIPIESSDRSRKPIFMEVNKDLTSNGYATIREAKTWQAAWVAVQPGTGVLFTSASTAETIEMYRRNYDANNRLQSLTYIGSIPMQDEQGRPMTLYKISGGAFSMTHKLYLVSNDDRMNGFLPIGSPGIHAYQISPGFARKKLYEPIEVTYGSTCAPFLGCEEDEDELEGIHIDHGFTYWTGAYEGRVNTIHVLQINVDLGDDNVWYKHFTAEDWYKF